MEFPLSIFKYYKQQFHISSRKPKIKSKKYVIWEDIGNCFRNKMKSVAIVHLNVKHPIIVLEKAYRSFVIKIKKKIKNRFGTKLYILCKFY